MVKTVYFGLLVCSLTAVILAGCSAWQQGTTPIGTPTPTVQATGTTPARAAVAEHVGSIGYIHMIDAATGWALAGQAVLRTTDGGTHWQDVTPSRYPAQLARTEHIAGQVIVPQATATFLTSSTGWVAVGLLDAPDITVFRTFNAGQTWQESTIHYTSHVYSIKGVVDFTFINTRDGWIMAGLGFAAGSEGIVIFHTTDGGATWTIASSTNPQGDSAPGALPFGGDKTGLSFLNASTGWITGAEPNNIPWLYVSHDGGRTWQHQSLQPPPHQSWVFPYLARPTFFNATDGVLPVYTIIDCKSSCPPHHGELYGSYIYVTRDGGITWHSTTLLAGYAGDADFVDLNHGWVPSYFLYMTSDAGQHWTKITSAGHFFTFHVDFVSNEIGWAIASYTATGNTFLLKTEDGGHTWTKVSYTVLRIPG